MEAILRYLKYISFKMIRLVTYFYFLNVNYMKEFGRTSGNFVNFRTFIFSLFQSHIDNNTDKYIQRLSDVVAIQSVSAWPESRPEVRKMAEWTKSVSRNIYILLYYKSYYI